MIGMFARSFPLAAAVTFLALRVPEPLLAQGDLTRAFDLERRGSYAEAALAYQAVLRNQPGEVSALLGLERSLVPLNRLPEMLPLVQAGIAANPTAQPIYGIALRTYSAANLVDSLQGIVEQWARVAPGDETPFREWGAAAVARRDRVTAKRAYLLGRERLNKPDALAAELAQLAVTEEDWPTAAKEWAKAVRSLAGYRAAAMTALAEAPERARPEVLRALEHDNSQDALRMEAGLKARWGDPIAGYKALMGSLPSQPPQAVDALQQFLEQVRTLKTPDASKVEGMTLEAIADRWVAAPQRARFRLDAARAYASAGDPADSRRMLAMIAGDSANAPGVAAGASATLIGLLVDEGSLDEATKRLEAYRTTLSVDEYQELRRDVALGWARTGATPKALEMLAADSTVEGSAAVGRVYLYAGNLPKATEALQNAGPFAGTREAATERSALLALLQPIDKDSLPALGAGFIRLDQGDSTGAAAAFEKLGADLPPTGGGAQLRLLAGRIHAARNDSAAAEQLFRAALIKEAPATAAAASLELGRLLVDLGRGPEAVTLLEQMILDYPTSALVPQARRLLDQARGATPKT
jgi:hypothetical protein